MKFAYLSAEDAQRLSADLRSVEAGLTGTLSLATAPILEAHQMYSRRTTCLSGYVFGHPALSDGREVITSQHGHRGRHRAYDQSLVPSRASGRN